MRDFTLKLYHDLLISLKNYNYSFCRMIDLCSDDHDDKNKIVILRHDVDKRPLNALLMGKLESALNIHSTYYFRINTDSFNKDIIKELSSLGHEIGYHYEDLSYQNGNFQKAINSFEINLKKFRQIYPIKTICMHGSPLAKFDNREIWNHYDYRDYGIILEPYFDINYNEFKYLTDTGRSWNSNSSNKRDHVASIYNKFFHFNNPDYGKIEDFNLNSTHDIINLIENDRFPYQMIINTHPQRWTDNHVEWVFELLAQNIKNSIKRFIN